MSPLGLDLSSNPWNCTCGLRPVLELLRERNVPSPVPPACATPRRLERAPWDRLELDDFSCPPRIARAGAVNTNNNNAAAKKSGSNVTLSCAVEGDPTPRVHWSWQGQTIKNGSLRYKAIVMR